MPLRDVRRVLPELSEVQVAPTATGVPRRALVLLEEARPARTSLFDELIRCRTPPPFDELSRSPQDRTDLRHSCMDMERALEELLRGSGSPTSDV